MKRLTKTQAAVAEAFSAGIRERIESVQRRCTARTVDPGEAIHAIARLARGSGAWSRDGIQGYQTFGSENLPAAYKYVARYTSVDAILWGDTVYVAIGRIACGQSSILGLSRIQEHWGDETIADILADRAQEDWVDFAIPVKIARHLYQQEG